MCTILGRGCLSFYTIIQCCLICYSNEMVYIKTTRSYYCNIVYNKSYTWADELFSSGSDNCGWPEVSSSLEMVTISGKIITP